MTQLEDRVRSGLQAEADAIARTAGTRQPTTVRRQSLLSGVVVAFAAAAVVLVVFGGVSLLTGDGSGVAQQPTPTPTTALSTDTSPPSTNGNPQFEAVPFRGETWQFAVTEEISPSDGTYEVCFALNPTSDTSDASWASTPWCDDWPKSDPRLSSHLLGVHHGLATETSYVMVVELNVEPVDRVSISGEGTDTTVEPFALPGSGKQFAVVEVPQAEATVTVSALNQFGAVLDEYEGLAGRIEPLVIDGTPIDDTTASDVVQIMGGEPMSDEDLERVTGSVDSVHSGYLIESTLAGDGEYELGLIVYREEPLSPLLQPPMICFSEYAMTQGINVAGGAACAYSQERAEELAEFYLGAGGACGPHPKEEPIVNGNWLTLAVWGIPETTDTLTVGQGDGTIVDIDVQNGVALHIWEGKVDIASITFDGMTQAQRQLISSSLPIEGIDDDCNPSDGAG